MTAYGAVLSLRNTINNILHCSRFSLVAHSQQIVDVVCDELDPLLHILKRLDKTSRSRSRKKVNALDGRIKEVLWKFEDSLESLLTQQILSQFESLPEIVFIDLQSLQNDVHSLIQKLMDMEKEYIYEVENMPQDEPVSSSIGFHGTNSKMIGLSDHFQLLKVHFLEGILCWGHGFTFYGMAGIGKTTLAMQIYEDPEIQTKYQRRAWVTVGRVPQPTSQILRGILAQLCEIPQGDIEISDHFLKEGLKGSKKCLIVLDDVWEENVFHCLKSSFQDIIYSPTIFLLTSRHRLRTMWTACKEVRFLNEEESMDLLCDKVFGDESCPPQLHKLATKIAKLCEGLPLLILTVADILSKSEHNRDPIYWNEVAEKRNTVFTDAYNQISKVLFPSYDYLPQNLKIPFLFMGVFPQDYDTPHSKIIIMLTAAGLCFDQKCLTDLAFSYCLVLRNLKSVHKTSTKQYIGEYKTYWLHSSYRHVCRGEASKNKFYHVLNKLTDASEEALKGQRGLCLENNVLFCIKEFCNSVRLNCASSTHFLLFYGPYHQYPIPIDVGFMLLREIDALAQRFYNFPTEILSLVQLKYLALTCNGELPATISKLFNLQALIIHPHMSIRRRGAPSYVPIQIWDMQELKHLEIPGKNLLAPSHVASLEKISTLVGVNACICTILELSRRIPNIRKLGIRIEVRPYDYDLLNCFGSISTLENMETLKVSITNPVVNRGHVFPKTLLSLRLPLHLKKLHLSGMGFPIEYMDVVGSLPYLEVLKLRSNAFQGSQWKTELHSFPKLKFLLIQESDLVQWKPSYGSFIELRHLSMKHCYKLQEIHSPASLDQYGYIIEIELEDCNPLALTCISQFQPTNHVTLLITASSSFYEKPTTFKCERYGGSDIYTQHGKGEEKNDDKDMAEDEDTNEEEEENDDEETKRMIFKGIAAALTSRSMRPL